MGIPDKLSNLFSSELQTDLKNVLITVDKQKRYSLFGKYDIVSSSSGTVRVFDRVDGKQVEFATLKYAFAWCSLRNADKWKEADKLSLLDLKLISIMTDISIQRRILKSAKTVESRLIYTIKLQEDIIKRRDILREINDYVNESITIQSRKFANRKERNFKHSS